MNEQEKLAYLLKSRRLSRQSALTALARGDRADAKRDMQHALQMDVEIAAAHLAVFEQNTAPTPEPPARVATVAVL